LSIRFLLAIIAFSAYAIQYTQKINMSVAIVCMINNTAIEARKHALANEGVEANMSSLLHAEHHDEISSNESSHAEQSHDSCSAGYHGKKFKMVPPFYTT
jgi:hypothetical protein